MSAVQTSPPAHEAFTRLLHRLEPQPEQWWREAGGQVVRDQGILVADDSTLDHPYAKKRDLVSRHWSGKHHAVVEGINLITLLWSEGDRHVPVDYRLYDKAGDGLSKNDHFQAGLARRAFLRLESHCHHRGISWFEAKHAIIRDAVRAYLARPLYQLISTA